MALNWRTYLPHTTVTNIGVRVIQFIGGRRWSLAIYIKPKEKS